MTEVTLPPTRPPTDAESRQAELIRGIAEGDNQALASLYDATSRTVYGLLLRILSDPSSAEEVLLDVYAQVWRQAAGYSPERGRPLAWLTTIARSRAIDRVRRARQEHQREAPLDEATRSACGESVEAAVLAGEVSAVVRAGEGEWLSTHDEGVSYKLLYADAARGTATTLVRMRPGSRIRSHRHLGVEQCLVLEGDVRSGSVAMKSGDFNCSLPGSVHEELVTDGGPRGRFTFLCLLGPFRAGAPCVL